MELINSKDDGARLNCNDFRLIFDEGKIVSNRIIESSNKKVKMLVSIEV